MRFVSLAAKLELDAFRAASLLGLSESFSGASALTRTFMLNSNSICVKIDSIFVRDRFINTAQDWYPMEPKMGKMNMQRIQTHGRTSVGAFPSDSRTLLWFVLSQYTPLERPTYVRSLFMAMGSARWDMAYIVVPRNPLKYWYPGIVQVSSSLILNSKHVPKHRRKAKRR